MRQSDAQAPQTTKWKVFSCDTYLRNSRVIQARDKDRYVVSLYLRVHRFRVLFFPSTASRWRNNYVRKISGILLLLTSWQGRIDRAYIFPSGKTCLTPRKSSTLVLLESHRSGRGHYWMRLYFASHYQTRMIVYVQDFNHDSFPSCRTFKIIHLVGVNMIRWKAVGARLTKRSLER